MYLDEWGPIAWELFHYIAYTYKANLKEYYIIFFNTIYAILPCPHCSKDIRNILTDFDNYPVKNIKNKYTMIKWFIQIHNLVNIKTHNKNRFTLEDSDSKYLDNNKITINHDRIFKFIKLALDSKLRENNIDLYRNIISLCHIYPIDTENGNIKLLQLCSKKLINNKDWLDEFKEIKKDTELHNLSKMHFNNTFIYPGKIINLNNIVLKKVNENLNDNILENKDNNLIFISTNNTNMYLIYTYESVEHNDKIKLYLSGIVRRCNMNIKIKRTADNKIYEYDFNSHIDLEMIDIKQNEKITIFFSITNKKNKSGVIIDTISFW
jgi:hypothetical protein